MHQHLANSILNWGHWHRIQPLTYCKPIDSSYKHCISWTLCVSAEIKCLLYQRVNILSFACQWAAYLSQSVLLHYWCYLSILLCVLSVAEVVGVCLYGAAVQRPNQPIGSVLRQMSGRTFTEEHLCLILDHRTVLLDF